MYNHSIYVDTYIPIYIYENLDLRIEKRKKIITIDT